MLDTSCWGMSAEAVKTSILKSESGRPCLPVVKRIDQGCPRERGHPPFRPRLSGSTGAQRPAIFMRSISTEPIVLLPMVYASAPMATMLLNIARRLPAIVTSCTG